MTIYTDNGYTDRDDYLKSLAADFMVSEEVVFYLANTLGPDEDFDGLVTMVEDISDEF